MRTAAFLFSIIFSSALFSQHLSFPVLKTSSGELRDFIPAGWKLNGKVSYGDLNKDKIGDAAFVIQSQDTLSELLYNTDSKKYDQEDNSGARILVVLFKNKDSTYRLALQNNDFILRPDEGGICCDPFWGLDIKNGTLKIMFYGGLSASKWENTYVLRYQDKDWYLIGALTGSTHIEWAENDSVDYTSGEETSYDFITGKVRIIKWEGKSDVPAPSKEEWRTLPPARLKTIRTLVRPMNWEIEPGIYL